MPFADFEDWEECVATMQEDGHTEAEADSICGALEAESKSEHGNVEELREALQTGRGLIADVGVDLVSGVDKPAADSEWLMLKSDSDNHDWQVRTPLLKADDSDQRISYAAAMVPREADKEGDVPPTPTVERAAHDFLKLDGGIDTDHSLIDGEGDPVESWILKSERTFETPDGKEKTYPEGTWMMGVEWAKDAWDRIKAGELTGLSIYGKAEHVALKRRATCKECGDALTEDNGQNADTHKGDGDETGDMGQEDSGDGDSQDGGPSIGEVQASVKELAETVESVKDAVDTEKQDAQEAAADLGDDYDVPPGDVLDIVEAAAQHDAQEVLEAIDSLSDGEEAEASAEESKEDDEDGDEEEEEKDVEKRTEEANLDKGGNARETAAKAHDTEEGAAGLPSYQAVAEAHGQED